MKLPLCVRWQYLHSAQAPIFILLILQKNLQNAWMKGESDNGNHKIRSAF